LEAAFEITRLEGIIPAIESAHALAILKKERNTFKPDDIVVITVSGRGDKDMDNLCKILPKPLSLPKGDLKKVPEVRC